MKRIKRTKRIFSKKKPEKGLLLFIKRNGGRNSRGIITVRHQGGGVKRLYRIVDFGQEKMGIPAKIEAIEYDPNRTAYIALAVYVGGEKRYILAPEGMKEGDEIICEENAKIKLGNRLMLENIPVGIDVFNVELMPGKGGIIVRSAGSSANVTANEGRYVLLKMPSGEIRKVLGKCFASVGQVSHLSWRFEEIGSAGKRRRQGWRPTVRGSAMNPCDHPHGGGEGRTGIGLKYPKTPWGRHALGVKTRTNKRTNVFIVQRRKKKDK
ncbi:50S ribosomal protein L2 [Candidatus Parcubacteria bacterium A4]|nr:MAG: 50S ribosomal protein L2 [Candidatus Parcubacteria bacterium A4]